MALSVGTWNPAGPSRPTQTLGGSKGSQISPYCIFFFMNCSITLRNLMLSDFIIRTRLYAQRPCLSFPSRNRFTTPSALPRSFPERPENPLVQGRLCPGRLEGGVGRAGWTMAEPDTRGGGRGAGGGGGWDPGALGTRWVDFAALSNSCCKWRHP